MVQKKSARSDQASEACAEAPGPLGYYSPNCNFYSLQEFREGSKDLGDASCLGPRDGEVTWDQFLRLEKHCSLPRARVVHGLQSRVVKS